MKCIVCNEREVMYNPNGVEQVCDICLENMRRLLGGQYDEKEIWFSIQDVLTPLVNLVWISKRDWFNYPALIHGAETVVQHWCQFFNLVKKMGGQNEKDME